jgi:ketosteroid isomerase-like protein
VRDNRDRLQPQVQTSTTDEDEDYIEKYRDILIKDVKELEVDFAVLITLFVLK